MSLSLLLVADSDSQLLACQALARFAGEHHLRVTVNAVPREGTPASVIDGMNRIGPLWQLSLRQLMADPRLDGFDAIGVYLTGSKLAEFRSVYRDSRHQLGRPLRPLFCGFNGVVLERFEEAIAWRLGYDLICLNGPRDQARLELMLRHTPFAGQRWVLTGLGRQRSAEPVADRANRLVFAEQVVIPAADHERRRLVRILAALARRSPDWEVLIRPRVAPHERTFHAVTTHITETVEKTLGGLPPNLRISDAPLADLLGGGRLLATVSSTAFFDALDLGCKPLVMADFGLRHDLGTPFFAGSGLLRHFDRAADIDSLAEGPDADPDWLEWVGYGQRFSPQNLLEALQDLKAQPPRQPKGLIHPGYMINAADLSCNQLRRAAEAAIRRRDYDEAARLLEIAQLQRPENRNIGRRLAAARIGNRIARRLALLVTPRFRA
ncbi:MAG: hypothetical protein MUD04_01620 [Cyanobium sp. Prado107]|jgi:hypothetical protein|nr:hypothetical protein [Cyanobium sp. Prado107]